MNHNILITSAGRRVELLQFFRDELTRLSPESSLFAVDWSLELSAACQFADKEWKVPRVDKAGYIELLLDLCIKNRVGMVVPTIDTELLLLAENRKMFAEHGIELIISSPQLISRCRDKRLSALLFKEIGVKTPRIFHRDEILFPCFAKPYDGSCSVGATTLWSQDQLTRELLNDEKMIFMELVSDRYVEYTVDAYYASDGTLKCIVPRERVEVRSGEISKGVTRRDGLYDYLLPACRKIEGARGCLTIQLFADLAEGDFYGLEVNPRFGGGYPLSQRAGANFPNWLIQEYFFSKPVGFYDQWEENLLMLRYDAMVLQSDYGV